MRNRFLVSGLVLIGFLSSGCGSSLKTYVKPGAPWGTIKRVAILPFNLSSEDPVQRQLIAELFWQELKRATALEVVEVPLSSPVGSGVQNLSQMAKQYQVDGIFSGLVDDTHGTVVQVRLQDAATEEILWSATYTFGPWAEYFSPRPSQQKFQRVFSELMERFTP